MNVRAERGWVVGEARRSEGKSLEYVTRDTQSEIAGRQDKLGPIPILGGTIVVR